MKTIAYIVVTLLILSSCSKSEELPVSVITFNFEGQEFELKLHRYSKVQVGMSDLFYNTYGFTIDPLVYHHSDHIANFRLLTFVYSHPDSIGYSNELSNLHVELINKSDSTNIYFSSEICSPSNFELVIDELEWVDNETGFYSGRFSGEICDSSQNNSIDILSGNIIKARL